MNDQETQLDDERIAEAVGWLCTREHRFSSVVAAHGLPSLRAVPANLESVLQIVTEQLISIKAAAAIWDRLQKRLSPFLPDIILDCSTEELLGLGLSKSKAKSFQGIARAVAEGSFRPDQLIGLDNDEVRVQLLRLPGVGPWTAEIFLLSALQRADAWPSGDLALQTAAADLLGLDKRPDHRAMIAVGAQFSPFRAVAARLLWSHYRGLKGMVQAP